MGIKDIIFFEDSKIGSPTKDIYICIYIILRYRRKFLKGSFQKSLFLMN